MPRPFRFGVSIANAGSAQEWRDIARKAEDLGYDTLHCADHLRGSFAPMVALSFAAEATTKLRLGTFVINNDFRHPVLLAREAATLDVLSGGRFELGLGAGHSGDEYREAGIPFDEPRDRVARLAEAVNVIKRLWTGEETTLDGHHYQVRGHTSHPVPVQQPIPLLIGGNGKNVLRLAAREADIVGFTGIFLAENGVGVAFPNFTADGLAERLAHVRETAGERLESLEFNVLVQGVETEKAREVAEDWASRVTLSPDHLLDSPFTMFGEVDALVDKLYAQRERLGISYISTHGHGIDKLAPIVARLAGK
jgi:probable F420-dependent oxidoreductase